MRTKVMRAVGDVVIGVALGFVGERQVKQIDVEFRQFLRIHGAQRKMADIALLGIAALVLGVDFTAIFHGALGEIKNISVGVVGRHAGEGPVARPFQGSAGGVSALEFFSESLGIFDLDPEMIETRGPRGPAGIDVDPQIAVADGGGGEILLRRWCLEAEHLLIELLGHGVGVANDGDVVDFGAHGVPFATIIFIR
jgi:hypothetical protein